MQVKVKMLGVLSFAYPAFSKFQSVEVNRGDTVRKLREHLGLSISEVRFVSVNGKMVGEDYILAENDEVIFFPAASGG